VLFRSTPRFAPLRVDADEAGLERRVPGAGPRPGVDPGWVAATGPMPAFRTVPRPAAESMPEPAAAEAQPEAGMGGEPPAEIPTADAGQAAETYEPFGTGAYPIVGAAASSFESSPSVFSAPAAASGAYVDDETDYSSVSRLDGGDDGRGSDSSHEVIVPSAEALGEGNRLPIFEAVESDWFRRGRQAVGRSASAEAGNGWASSAADDGWRAAEVVHRPSSGGVTAAGLPKRVPQANLVPGTAAPATGADSASTPTRSAAATRDRFASFQRGVRRGRAAAASDVGGDGTGGGEDEASG